MSYQDKCKRRKLLKSIGVATGIATIASPASASESQHLPEKFRVVGTKKINIKYRSDTININIKRISEDLRKRFGISPPVIENNKIIHRSDIPKEQDDQFPENGADSYETNWNTYLATAEEWGEYHKQKDDNGISTQHSHDPSEGDYLQYATYTYEEIDEIYGIFETRAPINMIFINTSMSEVRNGFDNVNWPSQSDNIDEAERYIWDEVSHEFVSQKHVDGYSHAQTKGHNFTYRQHVRYWRTGVYKQHISLQAHYDCAHTDPCTIRSYRSSMDMVEDIFANEGFEVHEDAIDLDNAAQADGGGPDDSYNGLATGFTK